MSHEILCRSNIEVLKIFNFGEKKGRKEKENGRKKGNGSKKIEKLFLFCFPVSYMKTLMTTKKVREKREDFQKISGGGARFFSWWP